MENKGDKGGRDLGGRVHRLAGLVEYGPGSIVSRTIIDKETGTLTLFAFDQGKGLSEHTAPFEALVLVLEGHLQVEIASEPHQLKEGEILKMPAHQPHALRAVERSKMLLAMIR